MISTLPDLISEPSKFREVKTAAEYKAVMEEIDRYILWSTLAGGFEVLTAEQANEFHRLALLAEAYEDSIPIMPLPVPPPKPPVNLQNVSGTAETA
jgi:hypothetical protein